MRVYHNYACVFERKELHRMAKRLKKALPDIMEYTGADTVVVSGKSGIAMGFALLMVLDFKLVVVRKPDEKSHGQMVEGSDAHDMHKYVILDDFVSSGGTVERIIASINGKSGWSTSGQPECVGVVQYQHRMGDSWNEKQHPRGLYSFRSKTFDVYDDLEARKTELHPRHIDIPTFSTDVAKDNDD